MSAYPRLAGRLYNSALLITPEKAEVIERVFRAHVEGTVAQLPEFKAEPRPDVLAQAATTFTRQRNGLLRSDNGVALIQVLGSLVQRGSGMDAMSGLESYDGLAAQLSAAMADPMVRGILLEFDSPGGEGAGVADLGDQIAAAADVKPIVAHANETAFSAAYWLASAANELMVARTGMVGSVGVIMMHVDQSALNAKRGLEVTHIMAGQRKADFSPHAPLSDRAMSTAQGMVDRMYGQFVDHVAAMRRISKTAVRDTQAGLLNPDQAINVGMADSVGTLGDALARLDKLMSGQGRRKRMMDGSRAAKGAEFPMEGNAMSQHDNGTAAPQVAAASVEQLAASRAEGFKDGHAAGMSEGASAERTRVAAILDCEEAGGREGMARHLALKTSSSPEDARGLLAVAPKGAAAPTNALAAAMAKVPNPALGANSEGNAAAPAKIINSADIFSRRQREAGHAGR